MREVEKYSGSSNIVVEAKVVGGVAKPSLHPSKRKPFLHLMPANEKSFENIPNYVKCSMSKYGTQIVGKYPNIAHIERIGLVDILPEPGRRIRQITETCGEGELLNRIFKNGKQIIVPNEINPDSLENLSYSVRNNAANIMTAFQPYILQPYFDNSPKLFRDFKAAFKTHPWKDLSLEIDDLTKQERAGNKVNISGLKEETLNFLAYNDQMIRNIVA